MARFNSSLISNTITGTTSVGSPFNGSFTQLTGTAPYTVTLASPALFPGVNQQFYNATGGTVTLSTPSGNFTGAGGSAASTFPVYAGNVVSVTADGTNYIVISEDGSALTATSATISGTLTVQSTGGVAIAPSTTGTIDNVNIGATTRGSGAFNTLTSNNAVTFTANTSSSSTTTGTVVVTGGLGVSGTINAASISASLTGTIQTASQPNITAVGTLSSLTVTGVLAVDTNTIYVDSTNHRLGVGTASPSASLHVIGSDARFGSGQYPVLTIYPTVNSAIFGLRLDGAVSSNGRDWRLEQGRSANGQLNITDITAGNLIRLMIDANGSVGIGITANYTGAKLFVDNSIHTNYNGEIAMRYNVSGSTTSYWKGMSGTSPASGGSARGLHFFNYDADSDEGINFWTGRPGSATQLVKIMPSGNVGIGTTNPLAKLSLIDENGGQAMLQIRNYSTAATGAFTDSYTAEIRGASSGSQMHGALIHLNESGYTTDRRTLDVSDLNGVFASFTNGRVGIGTVSPTFKLDVNGSVGVKELYGRTTFSTSGGNIDLTEYNAGNFTILEIFGSINPNSGGSSYRDPIHMYVYAGYGWNGSNLTNYIYVQHVAPVSRDIYPSGGGAGNVIDAVWYNGTTESDTVNAGTASYYVRLKAYNWNATYGSGFSVTAIRRA